MPWRRLVAVASAVLLLTGTAAPAVAQESTALLQLKLASGTSVRYVLRGSLHQEQTNTYSDESTETTSSDVVFEQVIRYDVGPLVADGSAEATVSVEKFTLQRDDSPASTGTNVAQVRGRLLPTGGLREITVVSGSVQDLDRLSIGAFAFEYPTAPMTVGQVVDRAFPILLLVTWHSERVSAHSQTRLTSLTPTSAAVTQEVDVHEADVPVRPTVTASADVTGTATHTIDRVGGWPRAGRAESSLETTIDSSAAQVDASTETPVPVLIAGSVSLVQTYERL